MKIENTGYFTFDIINVSHVRNPSIYQQLRHKLTHIHSAPDEELNAKLWIRINGKERHIPCRYSLCCFTSVIITFSTNARFFIFEKLSKQHRQPIEQWTKTSSVWTKSTWSSWLNKNKVETLKNFSTHTKLLSNHIVRTRCTYVQNNRPKYTQNICSNSLLLRTEQWFCASSVPPTIVQRNQIKIYIHRCVIWFLLSTSFLDISSRPSVSRKSNYMESILYRYLMDL